MRLAGLPLRHLRDAALIYVGVRIVLTTMVVMVRLDHDVGRPWLAPSTSLWCIAVGVLLSEVDLARNGAPELLWNLGISRRGRVLLAAAPMLLGEALLHLLVAAR